MYPCLVIHKHRDNPQKNIVKFHNMKFRLLWLFSIMEWKELFKCLRRVDKVTGKINYKPPYKRKRSKKNVKVI